MKTLSFYDLRLDSLFSVLIPTRYGGSLLRKCVRSLVENGPSGLHLIIVADGEPDLTGLFEGLSGNQTLEVERVNPSKGFCHAVNRGLTKVRYDWVQLLNDDAFVKPGWFQPLIEATKGHHIAAVAPLILQDKPGDIVDSAGDTVHRWGRIRKRYRGKAANSVPPKIHSVLACGGCAGFFRVSALSQVGGWDENLIAYFDDIDVSLRLREAGWEIVCQPASVVVHLGGQSYGSPKGELLQLQSRNEEWIFQRYPSKFPGANFARLVWNGLRLIFQLTRGTAVDFVRGKRGAHRLLSCEMIEKSKAFNRRIWPWGI